MSIASPVDGNNEYSRMRRGGEGNREHSQTNSQQEFE